MQSNLTAFLYRSAQFSKRILGNSQTAKTAEHERKRLRNLKGKREWKVATLFFTQANQEIY